MSTLVPITATHRGPSRRIVVEPLEMAPRKPEQRPPAPEKAPAESAKAQPERDTTPAEPKRHT